MTFFVSEKSVPVLARCGRAAVILGAVCVLAGCKPKPEPKNYLAKIGTSEIHTNDFAREQERRKRMNLLVPANEMLLQEMIAREALVLKAKEAGLERDPEVVRMYEGYLIARLKEREMEPKVKAAEITDAELNAKYQADIRAYTRAAKMRIALLHMTVNTNDASAVEAARSRLEEARKRANDLPASASGFGKLAVDFSEDQATRYKGGDAGWYDEGQERYRWPNEVMTAAAALPTNGVSEVISTARGLFLVKKIDARPAAVTPLSEVAGNIRRKMLVERQQRIEQEFGRSIQASYPLTINTQILSSLQKISNMAKRAEPTPPALPR